MYYPSSENKGADQLHSYREADLRLCFRLCRLLVFPWGGSHYEVFYINVFLRQSMIISSSYMYIIACKLSKILVNRMILKICKLSCAEAWARDI